MKNLMRSFALVLVFFNVTAYADDNSERERREAEQRDRSIAAEINRATDGLREKLRAARDAASGARNDASSIRGKASELKRQEDEARSRRMSMSGEIRDNNAEASRLQAEANSLRHAADSYRRQKAQVDAEISSNNARLRELLTIVYNLESKVQFKEKERDDLESLKQQINAVRANLDHLSEMQSKAAHELTVAAQSHMDWMKQLGDVTERLAPHFDDLRSGDDIKVAAFKASAFSREAPDPDDPNSLEEAAIKTERDIGSLTNTVQEQLRKVGSMPGLAVYHKYTQSQFDAAYWRSIDESVHANTELALQIDTLLKLFRERRGYLVRVIPIMWERMLNVRLDSIHLETAVITGRIALDGMALPELISKAQELDRQHNQAALLLVRKYSPIMAAAQIDAALELANRFAARLDQMHASGSVDQVRATIFGKRDRLQGLRSQISREIAADAESFLRKRRESIASINFTPSQSAECQALRTKVQQAVSDINSEIAYNSFMESCQ